MSVLSERGLLIRVLLVTEKGALLVVLKDFLIVKKVRVLGRVLTRSALGN
jgi:hypothetical protein